LRKFAPIASVCTVVLSAILGHTQQIDFAVGGGTTLASRPSTSSLAAPPPAEKGGIYPSVEADILLRNRIGLNVETSWREKQGNYYGYEKYRPILTDVNALFQPKLSKKAGLDFMGGVGVASNRFYLPGNTACFAPIGTCYVSANHFMEHLSAGLRYYAWRNFFVRPEIHYYHIQNNFEFNSDNLFRAAVSVGYTFGRR